MYVMLFVVITSLICKSLFIVVILVYQVPREIMICGVLFHILKPKFRIMISIFFKIFFFVELTSGCW